MSDLNDKGAKTADEALDTLLLDSIKSVRLAHDGIRASIERTIREIGEDYNDRKQSHLAYLQDSMVKTCAQIRQLQKQRQDQMAEMTDAERHEHLLAYLADAPEHFRAKCREVLGVAHIRSVL